jgi:ectoine hydroxylase-related dioxygenase (phytanoyl-CoA dioxygenase family)
MELDRLSYGIRTNGYTMLHGGLSSNRLEMLRKCFDELLAKDEQLWGKEKLIALKQYGALRNLANENAAFADLLQNTPVYEVIDMLLSEDYILHSFDGLALFPGDGRFPWDFHTDLSPLNGVAFPANRCPAINCLYYLDDVNEANGATWIVPASHRSLIKTPPVDCLAQLAQQAVGRAGDILMFDGRIWHCAGENRTDKPRRVLKALYCEAWFRPQMDYWRGIRPEVRNQFNPRTKRLIGEASTPPSSVEEFRNRLSA